MSDELGKGWKPYNLDNSEHDCKKKDTIDNNGNLRLKVVLDKLASFGVIVDLQRLKNAHEKYKVPRWYGQPNYVELWLEKKAAAETIMSFLGDRQVRVVPVGGFDSWGDAYKHSQRLKMIREDSKNVA